ncbi:MAG: hypothetical protein D6712_19770 [Chloroflexi bacterium]|nr:MAG: hypothetical protein D6712_19770 [Chloroflexota bacterium]
MANSDRGRKLLIRTALVTGSTVATLFGAQNLAVLDQNTFGNFEDNATDAATTIQLPEATQAVDSAVLPDAATGENSTANIMPTPTQVLRTSPNIVVLRQPGQPQVVQNNQGTGQTNSAAPVQVNTSIQPPAPVVQAPPAPQVVQAPAPVVVQQQAVPAPQPAPAPRPARTRSSR